MWKVYSSLFDQTLISDIVALNRLFLRMKKVDTCYSLKVYNFTRANRSDKFWQCIKLLKKYRSYFCFNT